MQYIYRQKNPFSLLGCIDSLFYFLWKLEIVWLLSECTVIMAIHTCNELSVYSLLFAFSGVKWGNELITDINHIFINGQLIITPISFVPQKTSG